MRPAVSSHWSRGLRARLFDWSGQRGRGAPGKANTPPKGRGGCRRAGARPTARPMVSQPLAPLDPHKTRALTTIYAPRKLTARKQQTATSRMLDDIPIKPSLSPFHPLPAIGQKITKETKPKVILFDLNKKETFRPLCSEERSPVKLQEVLQPLTPLRIHGYARRSSMKGDEKKPQQLLRENTYDVIQPVYVNGAKEKRDTILTPKGINTESSHDKCPKVSPKTRFKKAAYKVAKLSSMPETGKLLCLRERQTISFCRNSEDDNATCRLQQLPRSPAEKLNKLSEIFQTLDMNGRHRDKMKKENSWF